MNKNKAGKCMIIKGFMMKNISYGIKKTKNTTNIVVALVLNNTYFKISAQREQTSSNPEIVPTDLSYIQQRMHLLYDDFSI